MLGGLGCIQESLFKVTTTHCASDNEITHVREFFVKLRDDLIRQSVGYSENLGDILYLQKSFIHIAAPFITI